MTQRNNKKRRKKWPWIVIGSVGGFWITFIAAFLIWDHFEQMSFEKEKQLLLQDFSPWIGRGFCAFLERDGNQCIHLPNGDRIDYTEDLEEPPFLTLLSISDDEVLFSSNKFESDGWKTRIVAMDHSLKRERELLSISGDWRFYANGEGLAFGYLYGSLRQGLVRCGALDLGIGVLETMEPDSVPLGLSENFSQAEQSATVTLEDGYHVRFQGEQEIVLSPSAIDPGLAAAMGKWGFSPSDSVRWDDGSIIVPFEKQGGRASCMLMRFDSSGAKVIGEQFIATKWPYISGGKLFRISTGFPAEILRVGQ